MIEAQEDTDTLDLVPAKIGLDQVNIGHRPRLLSGNGASYISIDLAEWLNEIKNQAHPWRALSSSGARKDQAWASEAEEPHSSQ